MQSAFEPGEFPVQHLLVGVFPTARHWKKAQVPDQQLEFAQAPFELQSPPTLVPELQHEHVPVADCPLRSTSLGGS